MDIFGLEWQFHYFDSTIFNNFGETFKIFAKIIDLSYFVEPGSNFILVKKSFKKVMWLIYAMALKLVDF